MSQRLAMALLLSIPSMLSAQVPTPPQEQPRFDKYGDPLPAGAVRRLGTVRLRQEYVNDMAFMPDGKSLVVNSSDRVVQWDVTTGKPIRTFPKSPLGNRRSLGLSRDGSLLAVRPDNSSVVVYDFLTGKERLRKEFDMQSCGGVISPDNSLLAVATDTMFLLVDLKTGDEIRRVPRADDVKFSPDGKWLAVRYRERDGNHYYLHNIETKENSPVPSPPEGKESFSHTFAFTPDGKSFVASWWKAGTLIYDIETEKIVRHRKAKDQLIAISANGQTLAFGSVNERTVILVDFATGEEIRRWQVDEKPLGGVHGAFSPDGKILAIGFECGIQLWNPETGKRIDPYREAVHIPQYLAMSDDAKSMAVLYGRHAGQFLQVFDAETFQQKARLDSLPFTLEQLTFSPEGNRLLVRDWPLIDRNMHTAQMRVIAVDTGKEMTPKTQLLGFLSHWKSNDVIVMRENQQWVSVDIRTGDESERKPVPKGYVEDVYRALYSRDPRRAIVGNDRIRRFREDDRLFLADRASGNRLRPLLFSEGRNDRLDGRDIEFSPDERVLLVASLVDRNYAIYESATGRERFRFETKNDDYFLRIAFSPDAKRIVVGREGRYEFFDSLTFEPLMEWIPMTGYGACYAFSANGKMLVTGDTSSLTIWDLDIALRPRKQDTDKLTDARLSELWADLANSDAKIGHAAMVALYRRPQEAIPYMQSRLPVPPPAAATFGQHVRDLGDDRFQTREAANDAIAKMGAGAAALIRDALKQPLPLEAKRRLSALAEKLIVSEDERIRWLRCAEILDRLGTPEAVAALRSMRNIAESEVFEDAERSVARLTRWHAR